MNLNERGKDEMQLIFLALQVIGPLIQLILQCSK